MHPARLRKLGYTHCRTALPDKARRCFVTDGREVQEAWMWRYVMGGWHAQGWFDLNRLNHDLSSHVWLGWAYQWPYWKYVDP